MTRSLPWVFGLVCCSAIGCGTQPKQPEPVSDAKLVQIAEQHIAQNFPTWPTDHRELAPAVTDKGDYWEVTYLMPKERIGGVPVVHIDKKTLQVIEAYHTQ